METKEVKKLGQTRGVLFILIAALIVLSIPVVIFAIKADVTSLKDLAIYSAGVVAGVFVSAGAFLFGEHVSKYISK